MTDKTSAVYYCDLRTGFGNNLLQKLKRLIEKAGIDTIDFSHRYTAIKLHFGEPGNLAFLRPNFSAVLVEKVKEAGGKAFLTDCNTLYVGGRKNALDHLDSAYQNGFTPFSTGCHILIADGLKGTDEVLVPLPDGEYVKEAKIGRAVMDADIFISLNHFKGHEGTGFGGALKNIGMGCGSRAGKMEMHCDGKPRVIADKCIGCGNCIKICAHDAPVIENKKADIDQNRCVGCGRCIGVCPKDAIVPQGNQPPGILDKKIAEYSAAVLRGRPHFHVNLVIDVSPNCDCHAENDVPIVPDVGMFASFDPVALDQACADAVNRQPVVHGSVLDENPKKYHDHFKDTSPGTNWEIQLEHAEKMGIGTRRYQLIKVS